MPHPGVQLWENALILDASLTAVSSAIECVEPPGDFFANSTWARYPRPGLVADGVGDVPIPLIKSTAHMLIGTCMDACEQQPPNGGWEVSADRIRIKNVHWHAFVENAIDAARPILGIDTETRLLPRLRKLVLVEACAQRGARRHVDGGDLIVHEPVLSGDDEEKTHVWNAASADPLSVHCGIFYRDCAFQVTRVRRGYSVWLQYDLVVDGESPMPSFQGNHESYARLVDALVHFFADETQDATRKSDMNKTKTLSCRGKMVYVLQRKYTQRALSFDHVSVEDRPVLQCLTRFCQESGDEFQLCLCTLRYSYELTTGDYKSERWDVTLGTLWKLFGGEDLLVAREMRADRCGRHRRANVAADLDRDIVPRGFLNPDSLEFDASHDAAMWSPDGDGYEGECAWRECEAAALVVLSFPHLCACLLAP